MLTETICMTEEESYAQALTGLTDEKLIEARFGAKRTGKPWNRDDRRAEAWAKVRLRLINAEIERRKLVLPPWA